MYQRKLTREVYITDALKVVANNTAEAFGGQILTMRYCDIFTAKNETEETAEEIIDRIKGKLNGRI